MESDFDLADASYEGNADFDLSDASDDENDDVDLTDTSDDETIQHEEEEHFCRLYDKILDEYVKIPDQEISEAITKIKNSFRWPECGDFSTLDFNDLKFPCGYIYRFGMHGAGLARYRTIQALENCSLLRNLLGESELNVVSLGGGPANDAIGFCSAIFQYRFAGDLNIDIVDAAKKWRPFVSVVSKLLNEGNYGDVSRLFKRGNVEMNFLRCTVPGQLDFIGMDQFDVILICKLLSIIFDWAEKRKLVRTLHSTMKESALILLIDTSFKDDLWNEKFDILYLSDEGDDYCSGSTDERRFGHNDLITSRARIAVLKKKPIPPPMVILRG